MWEVGGTCSSKINWYLLCKEGSLCRKKMQLPCQEEREQKIDLLLPEEKEKKVREKLSLFSPSIHGE